MKSRWQSAANIALIKYWGKYARQLPKNPSLSMTLKNCISDTCVELVEVGGRRASVNLLFHGKAAPNFEQRVEEYINNISDVLPWVIGKRLDIKTQNTFPHSSGIASSASAMSALALCLMSFDKNFNQHEGDFFQRASSLARLGSGSASRSIYGGFSIWGKTPIIEKTDDHFAIPFEDVHPQFLHLKDAVLVVSSEQKKMSSSLGHRVMNTHPFSEVRYKLAKDHFRDLVMVMRNGDWQTFSEIVEMEALCLHALAMSADPAHIFLQPNSLAIIEKIKEYREEKKLPLCFTIDAGPNIHLLYPDSVSEAVEAFINEELCDFCQEGRWIADGVGLGPEQKNKEIL